MASKSKKIQKVIDGIRAWNLSSSSNNQRSEIEEVLKSDHFKFGKLVQYGFPNEPSCIAYEPVQKLLIIGTKSGSGRILGRPGVDHQFQQPTGCGIIQILFLINQGMFLTICNDETIHQWNYQSKPVELVQSLQFKRENLTCAFLSPGATWLYVGTAKGNVFFVNIKKFCISGYVINWNKAIDLSQSHHPGSIVQLGESPTDATRLLIGFSTGFLAIWNLREKAAKFRFKFSEALCGFSWFPDGKNFISCHYGGYLVTWNSRQSNIPISVIRPHHRESHADTKILFEPIRKVVLLTTKSEETIIVFSGGTPKPSSKSSQSSQNPSSPSSPSIPDTSITGPTALPSVTVMKDKRLTILQMDYPIIDFVQLSELCYSNSVPSDPFGIAILLENDLMVIDLLSPNYPSFENPYPVDLHISPITCIRYLSDCPGEFIASLYTAKPRSTTSSSNSATSAANKQKTSNTNTTTNSSAATNTANSASSASSSQNTAQNSNSSSHEWPINGGQWGSLLNSNSELIVTGHEDGSIRFWDATGTSLTSLYKFRLTTFLERGCSATLSTNNSSHTATANTPQTPHHQQQQVQKQASLDECGCPRILDSSLIDDSTPPNSARFNQSGNSNGSGAASTHYPYYPEELARQLAVEKIQLCSETKKLMIAGKHFATMLSFTKREVICDVPVLDTSIQYEVQEDAEVLLTSEEMAAHVNKQSTLTPYSGSSSAFGFDEKELRVFVGVKSGLIKWAPGYQPDIICRLGSTDSTIPSQISCIGFHSHYGLMAFGNEQGIAIVDFIQKVCLMSTGTPDLYGSNDPYNRISWSPPNRKDDSTSGDRCSSLIGSSTSGVLSPGSIGDFQPSNGMGTSSTGVSSMDQSFDTITNSNTAASSTNRTNQSAHLYRQHQQELKRNKSQDKVAPKKSLVGKFMKLVWNFEKYEVGHFSRSCSSSTSSLDNISCETITAISFADTYSRKSDNSPKPCLWLGTSLGTAIPININLPDLRTTQPVIVSPSGTIYRLRGSVQCIGFLDSSGELISGTTSAGGHTDIASPNVFENSSGMTLAPTPSQSSLAGMGSGSQFASMSTPNMNKKFGVGSTSNSSNNQSSAGSNYISKQQSIVHSSTSASTNATGSTASSSSMHQQHSVSDAYNQDGATNDSQYLVLCSEKSAEVISLPSQSQLSRIKITETSHTVRAIIVTGIKPGPPCLVVQLANGHLMSFSLPSLRLLMDIGGGSSASGNTGSGMQANTASTLLNTQLGLGDSRTMSIGNLGLMVVLVSRSEIEKVTFSAEFSTNIKNVQGDLFIPKELPSPPKKSFFVSLFNNTVEIDREELFGEAGAGKGSIATATVTTKMMDKAHASSANTQSEIAKARMAALERGEKLSEAELKTQEMMDQAKSFSKNASALAAKYEKKDKRWGLPF